MQELYAALAKFQGVIHNIELNADVTVQTKTGGKYTFQYATLGQIKDAIRKPLAENGLAVFQKMEGDLFVTRITHSSGQVEDSPLPFKASWNTSQEFGSLITYYRRYGLVTALGLVAEDDDDANTADGNKVERKEVKPVKPLAKNLTNEDVRALLESGEIYELKKGKTAKGFAWFGVKVADVMAFISEDNYNLLTREAPRPQSPEPLPEFNPNYDGATNY